MKTLKLLVKSFCQINKFEPILFPVTLILAVCSAISPFINIYYSSALISKLVNGAKAKEITISVVFLLVINALLYITNKGLKAVFDMLSERLCEKERFAIDRKLLVINFEKLEDSDFQNLLHLHSESMAKLRSAFFYISTMIKDFMSGLTTVICAFIMIMPLIKKGLTITGSGIFNSPWFLGFIVIGVGVCISIVLILSIKTSKLSFKTQEEYGKLNMLFSCYRDILMDYNSGKEIRLYNQKELIENEAVRELLIKGEEILLSVANKTAANSSFIAIIGAVLAFGIYLYVGINGLLGTFPIDALVRYIGAFAQVINGFTSIAITLGKKAELIPNLDYFFKIIETENEMKYGTKQVDLTAVEIEFKNVYFKYPSSENYILKNISLKINYGEKIAIVGRNGSGKTTFLKLLCRLYDVNEGEILINGINIKELTEECCKKLFAVVFQDYKLFPFSVIDNVCCGKSPNIEQFFNVISEVDMNIFLENMPNRENTYLFKDINTNGIDISGGEAQKLAIARALYKDSPVVLLDEPTSALDPISEYKTYEQFNKVTSGKTAIYISHRLSSCKFCDKIVVFKNGKIIQCGTHRDLLKANGNEYEYLWNIQSSWYA